MKLGFCSHSPSLKGTYLYQIAVLSLWKTGWAPKKPKLATQGHLWAAEHHPKVRYCSSSPDGVRVQGSREHGRIKKRLGVISQAMYWGKSGFSYSWGSFIPNCKLATGVEFGRGSFQGVIVLQTNTSSWLYSDIDKSRWNAGCEQRRYHSP